MFFTSMVRCVPAAGATDAVVKLDGEASSAVEALPLSLLVVPALQAVMTTSCGPTIATAAIARCRRA